MIFNMSIIKIERKLVDIVVDIVDIVDIVVLLNCVSKN